MKKLLSVACLLCFGFTSSYAQVNEWCGTDGYNEAIFNANPELKMQMHEHLVRVTSGAYATTDREEECIIPVVVHILHDNGDGNISYEQVLSGIDMLNEDFNRENEDTTFTRDTEDAPFSDVASNMGVRFELAKIDPDGNCTNGIERRFVGLRSYNASNGAKHDGSGGLNAWDRNYYFNIWIVNSIDSDGGGTILGYAEFPYGGGSSNYGVIIRNDAYGTVGTASGDRTLSHEVGHCLGLLHTFQGGCHTSACDGNGDYCCDTPPVSEAHWSCTTTQNSCTGIPFGDLYEFDAYDQFENFMSYSPCQNMFSNDQKAIVLGNFAGIGFMTNLVDPDHYSETGVGMPEVLCKAQFIVEDPTICAGNPIQFFDDSYSNVTGWLWTFEGGTPSSSTDENPIVTYDTPGNYTVELEVTDGASTESTVVEDYIVVMANPGISLPYMESFETIAMPDYDRFFIVDEDEEDVWEIFDGAGATGTKCVYIQNRGNDNRTRDELISGSIDLSGVDADDDVIFNFKYAYRRRHSSDDEWLRFYISNDCGQTWTLRKNIHGDDLSEEIMTSNYIPETPEDWVQVNITNINPDYYSADFRFKFQFENDNGNNIYLDDINMYSGAMSSLIDNKQESLNLSVYPNPASNYLTISLNLASPSEVNVILLNALGQEIEILYSGTMQLGNNEFSSDVQSLPSGIYFIRSVNAEGISETTRFVKD